MTPQRPVEPLLVTKTPNNTSSSAARRAPPPPGASSGRRSSSVDTTVSHLSVTSGTSLRATIRVEQPAAAQQQQQEASCSAAPQRVSCEAGGKRRNGGGANINSTVKSAAHATNKELPLYQKSRGKEGGGYNTTTTTSRTQIPRVSQWKSILYRWPT